MIDNGDDVGIMTYSRIDIFLILNMISKQIIEFKSVISSVTMS